MKQNIVQFENSKNKIDYSIVFDKIATDITETSQLYDKYASNLQNLIKTKEVDKLDKGQREDMIKEIILSTEYFLYRLKTNLNKPI